MTVKEYKEKFIDLYNRMQEEHGSIREIKLTDDTELYKKQMMRNDESRLIHCTILF